MNATSRRARARRPPAPVLLVLLGSLAACNLAPVPPPSLPPPPAAPGAAAQRLPLLEDPAPPPVLSDAPVRPFTGRLEPVALPPGTPAIVSIAGRDPRDVWLLARDGVLHYDGASVSRHGAPTCFTDTCCGLLLDCDKHPEACDPARSEPCKANPLSCPAKVEWTSIQATPDAVVVGATVDTGGLRPALVESTLGKDGRWRCHQGTSDVIYPGQRGRGDVGHALELTVDGAPIRLEGPAVLANHYGGHGLVVDGRRVPLPEGYGPSGPGGPDARLVARSPTDLWLWSTFRGDAFHGNGLGWYPVRTGLAGLVELWPADADAMWVLGTMDTDKPGKEQLLRWSVDGAGGRRFDVSGATSVVMAAGRFALVGKSAFYAWDGADLSHAEPPLDVADAWGSSSGVVWMVGAAPTAPASTAPGAPAATGPGAAVRVTLPGGQGT